MAGSANERESVIIRTSVIGIGVNIILAVFKAVIGLLSHSIAIVLDAVNNLSDALSSIITIVGTKLAGKQPDKKHPMGHGRVEYLTETIIAVIILYAGITSLVESVKKMIHPDTPDYSAVTLVIIVAAIVTKILLGVYVKKTGRRVNSESLVNSGQDAIQDAEISGGTLLAAGIYLITGFKAEAYLGALIALVIIRSGIEMIGSAVSKIVGERVEGELAREIKETVNAVPEVAGSYDLTLHNYGPDRLIGSIHVEVPDTMTANEIDTLERRIQMAVYKKCNVILTAVGIYSTNTSSEEAIRIRGRVTEIVMSHDSVLQMHGFYLDEEKKVMTFDVIVDFAVPDRIGEYKKIQEEVRAEFPDYHVHIALDTDISE